eukprot:6556609-Alexandrium_andersonii.AAC.1
MERGDCVVALTLAGLRQCVAISPAFRCGCLLPRVVPIGCLVAGLRVPSFQFLLPLPPCVGASVREHCERT